MAFNAIFYTLSKRKNSTLQPTGTGTTFSVVLKDNTSVMEPILQLHGATNNYNPSSLNYCYIQIFSRYYFVIDWSYNLGYWECSLKTDTLATYKTQIGNQTKYVLRSAYTYDKLIVDSFYPAKNDETEIAAEYDFGFNINSGDYVIGIVNRDDKFIGGATSYYKINETNLNLLLRYMYPQASETFADLTSMTMDVIRSIVNPWDWIVSCKKFPIAIPYGIHEPVNLTFGSWDAVAQSGITPENPVQGYRLLNSNNWTALTHDFTISNNWLTDDAKYRSAQNVKMFIICNPWGIIQLSPSDFMNSNTVRVKIEPDFITGNSLLKIYSVKGPLETMIAQKTANIAVETKLASSAANTYGALGGLTQFGGGAAFIANGDPIMGAVNVGAGILNSAMNFIPTMNNSMGSQDGFKGIEGVCRLVVRQLKFVDEDNTEFGKPLCKNVALSTLPGFIKCGDGEHSISCYGEEKDIISEFMTNGFFYE